MGIFTYINFLLLFFYGINVGKYSSPMDPSWGKGCSLMCLCIILRRYFLVDDFWSTRRLNWLNTLIVIVSDVWWFPSISYINICFIILNDSQPFLNMDGHKVPGNIIQYLPNFPAWRQPCIKGGWPWHLPEPAFFLQPMEFHLEGKIVIWLRRNSSFNVVSCFMGCISSGQILATSRDLTPKGSWGSEISLFQGNLGWWNNIIWPDIIVSVHTIYNLYVVCIIPLIPGYIILAITSGSLKKGRQHSLPSLTTPRSVPYVLSHLPWGDSNRVSHSGCSDFRCCCCCCCCCCTLILIMI